jgi:hypothetical protein
MRRFIPLIAFFCILLWSVSAFSQETMTITTYYPAPYGVYQELRAKRVAIGDNYYSSGYCWAPDICANHFGASEDLLVEGSVGIGTPTASAYLEVNNTMRLVPTLTPSLTAEGSIYYDSTKKSLRVYDGTAWKSVGGISEVTTVQNIDCWWGGGMHTRDAVCAAGYKVIGCTGGPGDELENNESFYEILDVANNKCVGYFREPACWNSETQQRTIAVCAR